MSRMATRAKGLEIAYHPLWESTKPTLEGLRRTAHEVAGNLSLWCKPPKGMGLSLSGETKEALRVVREMRCRELFGDPLSIEETEKLKKPKKEAKALYALEKRKRIQKWREKVAGDAERGDGKAIWKVIGARKKGASNVIQPVTDLNGESHISETEVDKAWAEHWRGLYDGAQKWEEKNPQAGDIEKENETLGKEIEERELDEALGRLKNWKSASGEGLPPELRSCTTWNSDVHCKSRQAGNRSSEGTSSSMCRTGS
ncbi:MAG: uncharacterized protein A8A55_1979 [Amphiamblys sp. WSBS2006]|nr:MAG: uncharacterized protein A8A55_1979 [Amphiamblys sp. WSBS2006]